MNARGLHRLLRPARIAALLAAAGSARGAEPPSLEDVTVSAPMLPSWVGRGAFSGVAFDRERIRDAPPQRLDSILRDAAGFRLFRRTDSIAAHPTSQGVSLRNVGPSGASRTVVLLDGVPMNDPFGGWVQWSRFTPAMLGGVSLIRDGGVSPWGTGSLGGVIALSSRWLSGGPFAEAEVAAGTALEHAATGSFAHDANGGATRIFGAAHHSRFRGYPVIREDQRGAVDIDAFNESEWFDVGARQQFADDWRLTLRAAGWQEERGNGTPLATSASGALDFSLRLERDAGPGEWSAEWIAYHQQRTFESTFTSVSADRRRETLTLDQYDVPAQATGFIHRHRLPLGGGHLLSSGFDLRWIDGETHERFRNLGAGFTRERHAGGAQFEAGLFVQDTWDLSDAWQIHAGLRVDYRRDSGGYLREVALDTGATLGAEDYDERGDWTTNLRLGATWQQTRWLQWRLSAYQGARQPTLNELYRPFRLGDTTTLANPALKPEQILGAEVGFAAEFAPESWLRASVFYNTIRDAVANVTLVNGPGVFPDWGFIAADGSGARRENLDEVRVLGLEVEAEWRLGKDLWCTANWLATDATVRRSEVQPALEGRQLAQVPTHQVSVGLRGRIAERWRWTVNTRWVGASFDDDQNERRLRSFFSVDAQVTCRFSDHAEAYVALENAFNATIETRRDRSGTVAVGTPRLWTFGLRVSL